MMMINHDNDDDHDHDYDTDHDHDLTMRKGDEEDVSGDGVKTVVRNRDGEWEKCTLSR